MPIELTVFEFDTFLSFTLAIILLFIGKGVISEVELPRRYSIPPPVIGSFLPAAVSIAYYLVDL